MGPKRPANQPPQYAVPLIGVKEKVSITSGHRKTTLTNSWREEFYLLLGSGGLAAASYFIKKQNVDTEGSLPAWFAVILMGLLLLMAVGCLVVIFWKPRVVIDKSKGTISFYTWRIMARPYLIFRREELSSFVVEEIRTEAPSEEPLYYVVGIETSGGIRILFCRLSKLASFDEFREKFAQALVMEIRTVGENIAM